MAPWADVLYAMDRAWWDRHRDEVDQVFHGERISHRPAPGVKRVDFVPGGNSGAGAMLLAAHFGAERIILLGYDCQLGPNGERHWHGDHPKGLGNAGSLQRWPAQFDEAARRLRHVEIANCSRSTALTCWPRQALDEALRTSVSRESERVSDIVLQGMHGLGDNIHQRAVLRQLMTRHRVWLETPWPSVYHDLVGDRLRLLPLQTRLRTQAKNARREADKYSRERPQPGAQRRRIWYSQDGVRRHGGFLRAMCQEIGLPPGDISLPVPAEWRARAQQWIDRWQPDKPLMIYRPLVERTEWGGCAQRNPDHQAYAALARAARERFFVVSIADLVPGVEWAVGENIGADVELHHGELDFETIAGLMSQAGLVFCAPGFALILAQAIGAPVVCVFGGHESPRLYDHGCATDLLIGPERPCECFSRSHRCDKTINLDRAILALQEFIDAHHSQPRLSADPAA